MDTWDTDLVVVGAGVVGLAVAQAVLAERPGLSALVLERHAKFGFETSSHNSEVIHAGIYYKGLPLKARHCRDGRELLYDFCQRRGIPHQNTGKFILATTAEQLPALEAIRAAAAENGVALQDADAAKCRDLTGNPQIYAGLWSPTTGIVNSHELMRTLEADISNAGAHLLYSHAYAGIESQGADGTLLRVKGPGGETTLIRARAVINAGGLAAARIANDFGLAGLEIRACRGRYFKLSSRWRKRFAQLIYPVPDPRGGLGVHLTFDLAGDARLGPDVRWAEGEADDHVHYRFEDGGGLEILQNSFLEAGRKLFPDLQPGELAPDYVGVRPKLFVNGEAFKDFSIRQGSGASWHLLGVESPGLTSSLSLAKDLATEVARVF